MRKSMRPHFRNCTTSQHELADTARPSAAALAANALAGSGCAAGASQRTHTGVSRRINAVRPNRRCYQFITDSGASQLSRRLMPTLTGRPGTVLFNCGQEDDFNPPSSEAKRQMTVTELPMTSSVSRMASMRNLLGKQTNQGWHPR